MKLDRATLDFLDSFSDDEQKEGERLHSEGAVSQIYGSQLLINGRVDDGDWSCRTKLALQGNEWNGESDDKSESGKAAIYATMLEKIARKGNLPEDPGVLGEQTLTEILEERLERNLTGVEDEYLNKLERRFRRFELEREIFDSDIVRLQPRWPVDSFDPLALWPHPPTNIIDFWNYLVYAFEKKNLDFPAFLEPITDREWANQQMTEWEHQREISEWRYQIDTFDKRPLEDDIEEVSFRLRITTREARLIMARGMAPEDKAFEKITEAEEFERLADRYDSGGLRMDAGSEILWSKFLLASDYLEEPDGGLPLDRVANCRLLNRLFHQPELMGRIVNLDERPFQLSDAPLSWMLRSDTMGSSDYELQLVTAEGTDISHTVRLLPGDEALYMSDEWVFRGPESWSMGETLIDPRVVIPTSVLEGESGINFLYRLNAVLPKELEDRITEEALTVTLDLSISDNATGGSSEQMLMKITAESSDGSRREVLGREGWEVVESPESSDDKLFRFDRTLARRMPSYIAPIQPTYDANLGCFRARVTKNFPDRYTEWRETLPENIVIRADEELATLEAEPVEAQVSFEMVDQDIDWFDLKVNVKVDGVDLSEDEIKALIQARGGFVRTGKGWYRLKMNLSEEQQEAVSRIGLDPFDLSGETHRMHALQLAEPLAKEVFDAKTWGKISKRSESIKLQVRPEVPANLNVTLRPYQVEGFHFLAYLTSNNFGGILADDMGLGKTIQSLTWLLWLRESAKKNDNRPSLVICPKSVLDVWGDEVKKAAPAIRCQVLRNRSELDLEKLGKDVDLLVINYSQLRTAADDLKKISWLGVILDEGQQIKNPDSKAAKSARELESENRLVLTGTPIENRLLDVWSLMAFSMPGILGDRKYFREHFDKRKDGQSKTRLTARLRPFLLRRTKGEVALDLPPKIEEDVFSELEEAQRELYEIELERIQKLILGLDGDEGLRKNNFIILQGLMRLRQICCHPGLVDSAYAGEPSAKMNALFYLLDQLHEEGHKVLVFSQFVSMLDMIKDELEERKRPYSYLTGQTKDRNRVISDFQESDEAKTFLLSLKAGGSGLNLTSASYVILYDPWWNPAVENQAIDRCHRIGQESKVNAYRLLVKDSVEEKIRVLQQQKSAMATSILGEEGFTRNLELDDLKYLFSSGAAAEEPAPKKKAAKKKAPARKKRAK